MRLEAYIKKVIEATDADRVEFDLELFQVNDVMHVSLRSSFGGNRVKFVINRKKKSE